jgi:hypothetical protein
MLRTCREIADRQCFCAGQRDRSSPVMTGLAKWPHANTANWSPVTQRRIGAMKFVASQDGPKVPADATVTSTVGIGPRSEGGFGLEIVLEISLPGIDRAEAEALVAKAHGVCPYSNATRNNVGVKLSVA